MSLSQLEKKLRKSYKVCIHIINNDDLEFMKFFTGIGIEYHLICPECSNLNNANKNLIEVNVDDFEKLEDNIWNCIGIKGQPEIKTKIGNMFFHKDTIDLRKEFDESILQIKAVEISNECIVIALTKSGGIFRVNLTTQSSEKIVNISKNSNVNLNNEISIHLSRDGSLAAIVNTKGQYGIVLDLITGNEIMTLDRGNYHVEVSNFPICFIEHENDKLMIHATEWNRLDITNVLSGKLITKRNEFKNQSESKHYLDYFHGEIMTSMDYKWIVDNGWIWHPVGRVVAWDLQKWVENNIWESEDGLSKKDICDRIYYWEGSMCWVDSKTIAVYGYGNDWIIPAVRIFDVNTGKEKSWFAGPKNALLFDEFLYSLSKEHGVEVWDIHSGERLHNDESLNPNDYQKGTKQFISLMSTEGLFELSRLVCLADKKIEN